MFLLCGSDFGGEAADAGLPAGKNHCGMSICW